MSRPRVWILSGITGLVVIAAILLTVGMVQHARDQRFLEALDADTTSTVGELPDEQLLVSREAYCEDIARGMTIEDVLEARQSQWIGGEITAAEYKANVRALFNAASVAC